VVEAVISLARAFGLTTVGEGAEDDATVAKLKALGVDCVQGFVMGQPRPAGEVLAESAEANRSATYAPSTQR
jgi:EAL domain-containing protein (putative c-di-GMP-specific phosphodiesterase class I)